MKARYLQGGTESGLGGVGTVWRDQFLDRDRRLILLFICFLSRRPAVLIVNQRDLQTKTTL